MSELQGYIDRAGRLLERIDALEAKVKAQAELLERAKFLMGGMFEADDWLSDLAKLQSEEAGEKL